MQNSLFVLNVDFVSISNVRVAKLQLQILGEKNLLSLTRSSDGGKQSHVREYVTVHHTTAMLGLLMFQSVFTFVRNCLSNDVLKQGY